jgi:hypothetical protein
MGREDGVAEAIPATVDQLMPQCTVRERDLFGFPRPGDPYWNDQTLHDVALRYPGMDLEPYRGAGLIRPREPPAPVTGGD